MAVGHFLAIELLDDVPALEAGLFSRALRGHLTHQRASRVFEFELPSQRRSHILDHYAQETTRHFAIADQVRHDITSEVRRNRETNPLVAAAAAQNGSVNADQPPFGINQRTAGVARI